MQLCSQKRNRDVKVSTRSQKPEIIRSETFILRSSCGSGINDLIDYIEQEMHQGASCSISLSKKIHTRIYQTKIASFRYFISAHRITTDISVSGSLSWMVQMVTKSRAQLQRKTHDWLEFSQSEVFAVQHLLHDV
ncbi:unnamed protein product [Amoebophrya sp. A120]|nr:unnamed protein product [Amoebophrya sp. A120]|eukprot:GSA120T00014684001.1